MIPDKTGKKYRHKNGGVYEVSYLEPVREHSGGPQLPDSNLINLKRVRGRIDAPILIITTVHDFKQSFTELRTVDLDKDTTTNPTEASE
jgi:hypothetical protein